MFKKKKSFNIHKLFLIECWLSFNLFITSSMVAFIMKLHNKIIHFIKMIKQLQFFLCLNEFKCEWFVRKSYLRKGISVTF